MGNFEIIDNFLSEDELKVIQDLMLRNKDFPYYFISDVTYENVESPNSMYFVHLFYRDTVKSNYFPAIESIIKKLDAHALIRVKGNLYPNLGKELNELPHIDYEYEHKGAIFYVNTNNGYTILEDGTKIESIANRLLKFKPHLTHTSTYCTDAKVRANININYF